MQKEKKTHKTWQKIVREDSGEEDMYGTEKKEEDS